MGNRTEPTQGNADNVHLDYYHKSLLYTQGLIDEAKTLGMVKFPSSLSPDGARIYRSLRLCGFSYEEEADMKHCLEAIVHNREWENFGEKDFEALLTIIQGIDDGKVFDFLNGGGRDEP